MANLLGMIRDPLRDTVSPLLQVCPFVSKAGDTHLIQQKKYHVFVIEIRLLPKRRASEKTPEILSLRIHGRLLYCLCQITCNFL